MNDGPRFERLKLLLDGKKQDLHRKMYRDAFDKLGRNYKTDFQHGMDEADWASIQSAQSVGLKLLDMQQNEFSQLNKALRKLEEGSYGICEACGEEISEQRLAAVFHAIYCIKCAEQCERRNRG